MSKLPDSEKELVKRIQEGELRRNNALLTFVIQRKCAEDGASLFLFLLCWPQGLFGFAYAGYVALFSPPFPIAFPLCAKKPTSMS